MLVVCVVCFCWLCRCGDSVGVCTRQAKEAEAAKAAEAERAKEQEKEKAAEVQAGKIIDALQSELASKGPDALKAIHPKFLLPSAAKVRIPPYSLFSLLSFSPKAIRCTNQP